jgi:hypothetical protein
LNDAPSRSETPTTVLESIEGTAEDIWPPSPPWQELHVPPSDDGRHVAFLVGKAGQSHWSASVELNLAENTLTFDVACRAKSQPHWLGSSYRRTADTYEERAEVFCPQPPAVLGYDVDRICIAPVSVKSSPGPWPQTFQWKYVLAVAPPP